ncbi:MAG: very short patch repair endonuclease [Candidatus Andeanibacterium colombiense]|uniref:Very short patch repair endonuclease n=1 Tax=Candidatus Andeanibacterium colombiense TaxID=3121345 RepID=A0AAJ5X497_9SPHN|nr:MAG: very short patch repair endonuclease [Sphingomonadaceae bacterium]
MVDIVSQAVRSRMMSGIRAKNTKPEMAIRRGLHALGFRFRIHENRLPGKPDLAFPKFKSVILVHGCFWHGHQCHLFRWPKTREDFWRAKIARNIVVDKSALDALLNLDWRVAIVWECSLKGRAKLPIDAVLSRISNWLKSDEPFLEIEGDEARVLV